MFDDLHDPHPPTADSSRFAAVAERAAGIRRRRRAVLATLGAVAVIGAGGLALNVATDDDDGELIIAADSNRATTTESPAPATTTSPTPTTTRISVADPMVVPAITPVGLELECAGPATCTYNHLADGRLVELAHDGNLGGPVRFTIYSGGDSTGPLSGEEATLDPAFDPADAYLLDVGPDDIAYIWWLPRDEIEVARLSAFALTGPEAGSLVRRYEIGLDFSGDSEVIPRREGFLTVGCCDHATIRPAPEAEIIARWVDRQGDEVVDESAFDVSIALFDEVLAISAERAGPVGRWELPAPEGIRGMPRFEQLDDGRLLYLADPIDGGGTVPFYLAPDGSYEVGRSPGNIAHALPDGRFVIVDTQTDEFEYRLVDGPPREAPESEPTPASTQAPTTTTEAPLAIPPAMPLVAIESDGDAVYVPVDGGATPILLYDGVDPTSFESNPDEGPGPNVVDHVAMSPLGPVAFVSECCEPAAGAIRRIEPPAVLSHDVYEPGINGYAPAISPDGTRLAVADYFGGVRVFDLDMNVLAEVAVREDEEFYTGYDLVWFDESTILTIGIAGQGWEVRWFDLDRPDAGVIDRLVVAGFDPSDWVDGATYRFAGYPDVGVVGVHRGGNAEIFLVAPADDTLNSLSRTLALPGPSRSAWYTSPEELVWVDDAGVLRRDGEVIPGEYSWARR